MTVRVAAGILLLAGQAAGQTTWPTWLYGVRSNGDLMLIDQATGAASRIGSSGVVCEAAAAWGDAVVAAGGPAADQIVSLNRFTGAVLYVQNTTGRPADHEARGICRASSPFYCYVVLSPPSTVGEDLLAAVDWQGAYTVIGATGRTDLEALARSPWGELFALGSAGGGALYSIDTSTGRATLVGGGGFGGNSSALEFLPDGTLLACGASLMRVDPLTGSATTIGPTGHGDIRGLAAVQRTGCYADCRGCFSGNYCSPPPLNVAQFTCFLQTYAVGYPYANCDESTTQPVLNVADFTCFLQKFASAEGCW